MLHESLIDRGYTKIKLHLAKTNHFKLIVKVNKIKGIFILDTGASNSCIDINSTRLFKLRIQNSTFKATGAGTTDIKTQISTKNICRIGQWTSINTMIVIIDLKHVNNALNEQNCVPIHGIIGSDILKKGNAIIDYKSKYLYLKSS